MIKRLAGNFLAVAIVMLGACAAPLWGQAVASAQISGLVSDPSGAAVPNATVTATQTNTGQVRTTRTGPDGTYVFPNLAVGPYRLDVKADGFQAYVQTGINLQVSNNPTINVTLHVGSLNQHIEVAANASMVQTQATSVSQVINQSSMVELPLNGRQPTQLVLISGAANNTFSGADLATSKNYPSSTTISVAGGQANGTNYLMDGGDNNDAFSNVNLPFPFPDALQEFGVQTSSLSAQYGLHPGAVVNIVTKSGSNHFHGDMFEFVRNGDFNARDFFAATQDTLRRNQFGGTLGAPILKDKLLGFFGYQGTRVRTTPPSTISYVPTAAVLSGDFSQLESAACQSSGKARTITNPATGQAFANAFVSPSLFNQQALNLLKYVPTSSNPCGELIYGIPTPNGENQYIGRVDWNQSAKNNFFGRYFYAGYKAPAPFNNNLLLSTSPGANDRNQSFVLGDTYSLSPTMVNSAHATWTRLRINRQPAPDLINLADVGVQTFAAVSNAMNLSVSGHFSGGCGTCAASFFNDNSGQLADDLDIMRGRHHISLGVDVIRNQFNFANSQNADGTVSFNGQFSGDSLVDFVLGLPSSFTQSGLRYGNFRQTYLGVYAMDNLRVSRRFSIQLGLRWEPDVPEHELHKIGQATFNPAAFAADKESSVFANAPPGWSFTGDAGMPSGFSFSQLRIFNPRVGLIWDPTGSGRQTIRVGYGMFHDLPMVGYPLMGTASPPWGSTVTVTSPGGGLTNPWQGYAGGDPFPRPLPSQNVAFVSGGTYYDYRQQPQTTYTEQWDVSYQLQLTNSWLLSATYMGNKTTHIWTSANSDPSVYIPGTCNGSACSTTGNSEQRSVYYLENPVAGAMMSIIYTMDPGSNGEYQGLLLSAEHRFSRNYTLMTNYNWSHCIDETDFQGDMTNAYTENPYNRNADRGNCGFDLRNMFNLSFVATTPRFAGVWTNRLVGVWQLAPIVTLRSGNWFSPVDGLDNSLTNVGNDRPNAIGNPYVRNSSTRQWLSPSAFADSTKGTYGNAGRDALLGPAYADVDAAVSRYFNIKENQKVELRFEFFNLFNRVNFSVPSATLKNSTFGVISSDMGTRILEFALKYTF